MKIDLKDLNSTKAQTFLLYFISELKKKTGEHFLNGSAQFTEEGNYETFLDDLIETNNGDKLLIGWKIIQNESGEIPFIEALTLPDRNTLECSDAINKFVQEILKMTLAESKQLYFKRIYYLYKNQSNLQGEYWFNSKTRIAPLRIDDKEVGIDSIIERILVIDQEIEAIDETHASKIAEEKSIIIAARLAFIFNIGFYQPSTEFKYVLRKDKSEKIINERLQTGFFDEEIVTEMPKKGLLCPLSKPEFSAYKFDKSIGELLNFPKESREIFRLLDNDTTTKRIAFDNCCRLYQTALNVGINSPTVKLSYMVSAVEAIAQRIDDCKGFSQFMRKYKPDVSQELLDYLYEKVRNSHFHSGLFNLGENESSIGEHILKPNFHKRFFLTRNAEQAIRVAILNCILENNDSQHGI